MNLNFTFLLSLLFEIFVSIKFIKDPFCNNYQNLTWQCEVLSENKFKNILSDEAPYYLGLVEPSDITDINKKLIYSSSIVKDITNFDLRLKWASCVDYIEDQCDCTASPAFAMTHTLSDRICILKNGKKPYHMSIQSIQS